MTSLFEFYSVIDFNSTNLFYWIADMASNTRITQPNINKLNKKNKPNTKTPFNERF